MNFIFKKFKKDQQKRFYRVFLLTDGQVDEPQKVIDLIREKVNARQKENVDLAKLEELLESFKSLKVYKKFRKK